MGLVLHHHPFASYCWKVLIALYERDVPFAHVLVEDRAELAALWPPATIPVLVDGDAVVPESTSIVEHLDGVGDAPPLCASPAARLWDRVSDGQVMAPMQKVVLDALRGPGDHDPTGVAEARATLRAAYALFDARLAGLPWLGGETFSLADCAAAPALHYAQVVEPWDAAAFPALSAYVERVSARPSVARVIDEARPYRPLFPLPWPAAG